MRWEPRFITSHCSRVRSPNQEHTEDTIETSLKPYKFSYISTDDWTAIIEDC